VDCEAFEIAYEETYTCKITLTEADPYDKLYIVTDPIVNGFPMEVATGTQTIPFLNDNSKTGEFQLKVNVRDDNWAEDTAGKLEGTLFSIFVTYFPKPEAQSLFSVDPILMKTFEVKPTDTYKVFLNNFMPSELKNNVEF